MNIQDECSKIHSKYGMSETANYKIQLLFDSEIEKVKKEYEEKLRWIPIEEKEPPLNEQVILKYDTDEYCIGVLTVYGFYLQPFDPIENDFGSIFLAGTVNAWRSFL